MKKIKAKIINEYNRYLISSKNSIRKELRSLRFSLLKEFSRFSLLTRKIFLYFVRLKFMKNKNIRISVFSRYLILLIVLLFSYIFYLSVPSFYNYDKLQKDLTTKLLEDFNLNVALSGNITYKLLPTPNFEISDVILSTDSDEKFNEFAEIKKMKIYVSVNKLYDQKKIEIKKILLLESNFNINQNSFNYIVNYLKKKISNKKILVKKSKIFFRNRDKKKDVVTLFSVKNSKIFYDEKDYNNKMLMKGSVFNTKFDLSFLRNIENLNKAFFEIKLYEINSKIRNELIKLVNKENDYEGKTYISILGSEININYEFKDEIIFLSSDKSSINNKNYYLEGKINTAPFYFDIDMELEDINTVKLIKSLPHIKNLFQKSILLNNNFNGKISFNINSLKNIKLFDQAKINLKFENGKFIFEDTFLLSNNIGKLNFIDSELIELQDKQILKTKVLFEIKDQKKFFQLLQIPKSNRIKLNNIFVDIEKNLYNDDIVINKFIINSKIKNNFLGQSKDITEKFDYNIIKEIKNWIEIKQLSNQIFSEIK